MPFHGTPYWALSEEIKSRTQKKISEGRIGEANPHWKGDSVGYDALHDWVKSRLDKPELCQSCGLTKPMDLASKGDKYTRKPSDWWWICRYCHMVLDGRLAKLVELSKKRGQSSAMS